MWNGDRICEQVGTEKDTTSLPTSPQKGKKKSKSEKEKTRVTLAKHANITVMVDLGKPLTQALNFRVHISHL